MTELIRTRHRGCFKPQPDPWGVVHVPVADPLADRDDPPAYQFKGPKLGSSHWTRITDLFYYLAKSDNPITHSTSEVQVVLARSLDDPTLFRCFVPKQEVSGASVDAKLNDLVDLETGEHLTDGLPDGWAYAGSVHSHNNMSAFWSSTDDADQLKCWGLHFVVGELNKQVYEIKSRVTMKGGPVDLPWHDTVDATFDVNACFNELVLTQIEAKRSHVRWVCFATTCAEDARPNDRYCSDECKSKDQVASYVYTGAKLCFLWTCRNEQVDGSKLCKEHSTTVTPLLLEINQVLEEYLQAYKLEELDSAVSDAIMSMVRSRTASARGAYGQMGWGAL